MHVLHVIESMGAGGAERHLANLLGPLSRLGIQNTLFTFWPGKAYEDQVLPFVDWHACQLSNRKVLPAFPKLLQLAKKADLIHTQLAWADIVGRLVGFLSQRPVVSTIQSTWYAEENIQKLPVKTRQKARIIKKLDSITARGTKRFFAVSEATREVYCHELHIDREKVDVIPNTVDLRRFDPQSLGTREEVRASLEFSENEISLLYVGRMTPSKRVDDAITAVEKLSKSLPVHLYLAGLGEAEESLRQFATRLDAPVSFLGRRSDIPRLLFAADLFLFPSAYEGLPLALIEAMAMSTPCLCSDIPENREVVGEAGLYAPVGDIVAWTKSIKEFLDDPSLQKRLRRQARERVLRFDAQLAAERLMEHFKEVCS